MVNWKEYEKKNDIEADEIIAKASEIAAAVVLAVCLLNYLDILFNVNKYLTFICCFITVIFLCVPCVLINKLKHKTTTLRYGIVICILLAVTVLYSFFTYHAVIAFVLPMVIASFYADIVLYIFTVVLTYVSIIISNIASIWLAVDSGETRLTFESVVYKGILPLALFYTVVAIIEYMSIKRSNEYVNQIYYNSVNLEASHDEMRRSQEELVYAIANISEYSSSQTGSHIKRVSECAKIFGKYICEDELECEYFSVASMLHDVGKLMIPNYLIEKTTRLTDEEYEIVKQHTDEGRKLLLNTPGRIMEMARNIAFYHHERWDGTGYHHIKGDDIEYYSRYVAVLDVFDALLSPRSYKKGWSYQDVYNEIISQSGRQFAPEAVEVFKKCYPELLKVYGIDMSMENDV
ncbi:MAG: HD domain-containing protein [Lachnospiraceae bacterium]|nr:HD domain-containing protein [Lachnospiraceae bacterium]